MYCILPALAPALHVSILVMRQSTNRLSDQSNSGCRVAIQA